MRIGIIPCTTGLQHLIRAANEGDQAAWDAIVDRFAGLVWATVRAHRLADSDASDVAQTTWLRLVENLDRIHDPERLAGWIVTTTRRECLRVIGRRGRELPTAATEVFDRARADPVISEILTDERDVALLRAFETLDERCRMLLRLLAAAEPPSYEQVGVALGMPIGSIGPTRARCLEKLRRSPQFADIEPG